MLGGLGISGSSLGLYGTDHGMSEQDAGVLAGPSRPIRSDEWLVRTPWVLRHVEKGLPEKVDGGLGAHDVSLLYDLPTPGWEVVLRPQTAVYWLLDAEHAFAVEWWSFPAIQLLGVYALLLALTGRVAVSALASSLLTLSPVTQWWSIPATFTTIGWGSLATALVLFAYRARTGRRRLICSALAGLAGAAFLATLYPPWQVGAALVLAPVGLSAFVPELCSPAGRRDAFRRLVVVLPVTALISGALFGGFVLAHGAAIEAVADTVYPGQRDAELAGTTDMRRFTSAPFDYFASQRQFASVNHTNQSENSSALPLLLPVALATAVLLLRGRLGGTRLVAPLLGSLVGGGLLAAWMFLPVPTWAGRLLFLTRVPPARLLLPFGFAGFLGLALLVSHQREAGAPLRLWQRALVVAPLGAALAWGAIEYDVDGAPVRLWVGALFVVIVLAGVVLCLGRRPLAGLAILALFTLWQASLINPLQDGTAPLTESPLRAAVDELGRAAPPDASWLALQTDATVKGTITAAGVDNLSGISPYPNRAMWRLLDPSGAAEEVWNRYAHLSFLAGEPGTPPSFELRAADDLAIRLDPCSPVLRQLGVVFMVTQGFEMAVPCVRPIRRIPYDESYVMVYRYDAGT